MAPTIFHTLVNFFQKPTVKNTAEQQEKERIAKLKAKFADNSEKENKSLKEKRNRVNGKWNQFKSIFGFGEKLTKEDKVKLTKIDQADRWKSRFQKNDSDASIWTE